MSRFYPLIIALLITGCATPQPVDSLSALPANVPVWVLEPTVYSQYAASGGAAQMVGGVRFQQIEAVAQSKENLRKLVVGKSLQAASQILDESESKLASEMAGALAARDFKRAENWWSPAREFYVLYLISADDLRKNMIEALLQFESDRSAVAGATDLALKQNPR